MIISHLKTAVLRVFIQGGSIIKDASILVPTSPSTYFLPYSISAYLIFHLARSSLFLFAFGLFKICPDGWEDE